MHHFTRPGRNITASLVLFFGSCQFLAGQHLFSPIRQRFEKYHQLAFNEKLFVHTDRQFYLTGENIWFRVYAVEGATHMPAAMSQVAYVELLDKDQQPVLQTKVSLDQQRRSGVLFLPVSLKSGNYLLRAYTNWMKNGGPDYFFRKNITVVNPFRRLGLPVVKDTLDFDIQFFPEGGNLVADLPAKIAFKAVNGLGKGIAIRGSVLAPNGDTVARFRPHRFGTGHFALTPAAGAVYKVVIRDEAGHTLIRNLPQVYAQGYVMQLEEAGNNQLRITVVASPVLSVQAPAVYLLAHTRGQVKVAETRVVQAHKAIFLLDKKSLGDGITHFTLFNEARKPVCERLYFRQPEKRLVFDIHLDKKGYAAREKLNLDFVTRDAAGNAGPADMSVSVFRLDSLESDDEAGMLSYLYLNADLKGAVESPESYFSADTAGTAVAADNLMLTQGWRRFRWEDILRQDSATFAYLPEFGGHIIRGNVINTQTQAPAPNILTYLSAPGRPVRVYVARSGAGGQVHFEMQHFFGPREVVVQTNPQRDSLYRFELESPYFGGRTAWLLPRLEVSARLEEPLRERNTAMQVQNVFVGESYRRALLPVSDTSAFYGKPDEKYVLDEFTRFTTMEDVLREYVVGVMARKRREGYSVMVYDRPHGSNLLSDPMVLLDGVPIFDMDKLMAINPLTIRQIDVMHRGYYLGPVKFSGLISLQTYNGNLAGFGVDPRSLIQEYEGLQGNKEFYAPRYDTPEQRQGRLPDFRNLLYWSPNLRTDAQGKGHLEFYTSDQEGQYKVVIQGILPDGSAGSQSVVFGVKSSVK